MLLCEVNPYAGTTFFFPLKSYQFLPFNHYSLKNPFSPLFYFSFPPSNCFKTLKDMSSPRLLLKDLVDFLLTPLNYTSQYYQGFLISIMSFLAFRHISHLFFFFSFWLYMLICFLRSEILFLISSYSFESLVYFKILTLSIKGLTEKHLSFKVFEGFHQN